MKWNLLSEVKPSKEDELLVFCEGDGIGPRFYMVDAWHNGRGEFMDSHCNGFIVISWAEIEEPPQDIMEVKNTANQQLKSEIAVGVICKVLEN